MRLRCLWSSDCTSFPRQAAHPLAAVRCCEKRQRCSAERVQVMLHRIAQRRSHAAASHCSAIHTSICAPCGRLAGAGAPARSRQGRRGRQGLQLGAVQQPGAVLRLRGHASGHRQAAAQRRVAGGRRPPARCSPPQITQMRGCMSFNRSPLQSRRGHVKHTGRLQQT